MKALRTLGLIGTTLLLTVLLVACGETAMQGTTANTANQSMNNQNAMNNKTDSGNMYTTPTTTSKMNTNNNGNMNNTNNNMNNNDGRYHYRSWNGWKYGCVHSHGSGHH